MEQVTEPRVQLERLLSIDEIYTSLGIRGDQLVVYKILKQVKALLNYGIQIGFVSKHNNNLKSEGIQEKWFELLEDITSHIQNSGLSDEETSNVVISSRNNLSASSNLIVYFDISDNSDGKELGNSNINGIKLVFIALLIAPVESLGRLRLDDVAKIFKSGIGYREIFPDLALNFGEKHSISALRSQCEGLIQSKYQKHGNLRKLLTTLRESLLILEGFYLGQRHPSKPSKAPNKRSIRTSSEKNKIRLNPYYLPENIGEDIEIGDVAEIITEAEEENVIAFIESFRDEPEIEKLNSNISQAISQFKSKFWLENFNSGMPWSSRGLTPFTEELLVTWIKENDTLVSLIIGVMLCTGRRIEEIIEFRVGANNDITTDGIYIKHYIPPDNCIKPSESQMVLMEENIDAIQLPLPSILKERFSHRCCDDDNEFSLEEVWGVDLETIKHSLKDQVKKLIGKGCNGLAIDRIPLVLGKKVASITGDEFLGYLINGRENDNPPVSSYYSAYSHDKIVEIYKRSIHNLFK
jgi:hypothetical protein